MASSKDALMASLMGPSGPDGDLFTADSPLAAQEDKDTPTTEVLPFANDDSNDDARQQQPATANVFPPPPSTATAASRLMASGLLGNDGGGASSSGGGGGLFDEIDQEEARQRAAEEKARREEELRLQREFDERARRDAEEQKRRAEEEERQRHLQEEHRRRQDEAAKQQQMLQSQMQNINLGGPPPQQQQQQQPPYNGQHMQQQQPSPHQHGPPYPPYPSGPSLESYGNVASSSPSSPQRPPQNVYGGNSAAAATASANEYGMLSQQQQQLPAAANSYGMPPQQQPDPMANGGYNRGGPLPPPPDMNASFYRNHTEPNHSSTQNSVYGGGSGGGGQASLQPPSYPPHQGNSIMSQSPLPSTNGPPSAPQQQQQGAIMMPPPLPHGGNSNRYYQPSQPYNAHAGMHHPAGAGGGGGGGYRANNAGTGYHQGGAGHQQPPLPPPPPSYGTIRVTEPMMIQPQRGLLGMGQAPYWSYQISTQVLSSPQQSVGGVWYVRRRFRHVVALEDRLRLDVPGAILPPRPEKHATRALEEATAQQSQEFALQRAAELEVYLNQLAHHPYAAHSHAVRLFLSLQDDMGAAWPEVSSNALARWGNASVGAAVKFSEQNSKMPWDSNGGGAATAASYEDDAVLLALSSAEHVRMGAVLQAVPKLEGAVTLLREYAEQSGAVGLEIGRLAKDVEVTDRELGQPMEMLSNGLLRSGRRGKRLALELSAAMNTFSFQHKLVRYERLAMQDRRTAMTRKHKERGKADQRAQQLYLQQRQYGYQQHQPYGGGGYGNDMDRMEREAAMYDGLASEAVMECNEIGQRLKMEIQRVTVNRRKEWSAAVKVVASSMKEALAEQTAIWTQTRETFLSVFSDYGGG